MGMGIGILELAYYIGIGIWHWQPASTINRDGILVF
jgi:hypothetical protein